MKQELLNELKEKFELMKNELGFKSSFEEIDSIFFISDYILRERFVSENLSRKVCSRMVDLFMSWSNYFHSIIMPNPQNILNASESKVFDSDEKKEMTELMKKIMAISSKNSLNGLTKDKKREGEFIDYCVGFWQEELKEKVIKMMTKINKEWEK